MDLDSLYDKIQSFEVESAYPSSECRAAGNDILGLLRLMAEVVDAMKEMDSRISHANNIASCLANGIQPD